MSQLEDAFCCYKISLEFCLVLMSATSYYVFLFKCLNNYHIMESFQGGGAMGVGFVPLFICNQGGGSTWNHLNNYLEHGPFIDNGVAPLVPKT